jgi:hypothetical protein
MVYILLIPLFTKSSSLAVESRQFNIFTNGLVTQLGAQ